MKFRKRTSRYSLDYITKFLCIALLPAIVLDILITSYASYIMRSQTVQQLQNMTSLYISGIDTAHVSINKYLIRSLSEKSAAVPLLESTDRLEFISSLGDFYSDVSDFLDSFEDGYQIFFYNRKHSRFLRPREILDSMNGIHLEKLEQALTDAALSRDSSSSYSDAWETLSVDSKTYFYKIFQSGENYAGAFINAGDLVRPLSHLELINNGYIALTAPDGTALEAAAMLNEDGLDFAFLDNPGRVTTTLTRLIINGPLTMGAFYPHIILNKFNIYEKVLVIQAILIGAVLLIGAGLLGNMIYMNRKIIQPIKAFSENLSQADSNSMPLNLRDSQIIELEQANLQFKNLMRQITRLKIDIYEQELEKQKNTYELSATSDSPPFFPELPQYHIQYDPDRTLQ